MMDWAADVSNMLSMRREGGIFDCDGLGNTWSIIGEVFSQTARWRAIFALPIC
jgi:hypothetical protein